MWLASCITSVAPVAFETTAERRAGATVRLTCGSTGAVAAILLFAGVERRPNMRRVLRCTAICGCFPPKRFSQKRPGQSAHYSRDCSRSSAVPRPLSRPLPSLRRKPNRWLRWFERHGSFPSRFRCGRHLLPHTYRSCGHVRRRFVEQILRPTSVFPWSFPSLLPTCGWLGRLVVVHPTLPRTRCACWPPSSRVPRVQPPQVPWPWTSSSPSCSSRSCGTQSRPTGGCHSRALLHRCHQGKDKAFPPPVYSEFRPGGIRWTEEGNSGGKGKKRGISNGSGSTRSDRHENVDGRCTSGGRTPPMLDAVPSTRRTKRVATSADDTFLGVP